MAADSASTTLHQREELLRLCFDAAPAGIAMFDREMRYVAASKRYKQDHGVADQDLIGRSHYDVFPEIPEWWRAVHKRCLAGATERREADPFRRADGTLEYYRWEIRPWYDATGDVGGIVLFSENVTAQMTVEAELRRWADAFENAAFGIAITEPSSGTIAFANAAFAALRGMSIEEVKGTGMIGAHPAPEHPRIARFLAKADRVGRAIYDSVMVRKDGSLLPVQMDITSVCDADRTVRYRIATALDIAERERAKQARRDSEAAARHYSDLLDSIIATMADAVLVADRTGKTLFANPACKAMFGDRDDIGSEDWQKTYHRFRPDGITPYPPDETPVGRAIRGEDFDNLHIICRRDGNPRATHIVASGRAIRNQAGVHERAVIVYRDVTELTEKTHAMQRNAELLDKTIAAIPDAFLVTDQNKNFLLGNPACETMLGINDGFVAEDWERTHSFLWSDGVTPVPYEMRPLSQVLTGASIDGVEYVLRDLASQQDLHLSVSGRPIHDARGEVRGGVLLYHDLTKAKQIERQLRHSQKMDAVGQLTGGVAHDFNNILTAVTCTIEILAKGVADRPQLATIAKIIDQAARRGTDLTRQLLAFARRQPLQPRETDVNALIVDTARLLRPTLGEHIDVQATLADELWPAMVDASQLSTAIINLAVNARDAMPQGGKLTLETRNIVLDQDSVGSDPELTPGDYVMIAVSDNGYGIPPAVRDKVFEPFFTTKEVGRGTGLGLSMVYGFTRQSGGHVTLYSEEGHGTTIRLYLPRKEAQEAASEIAPPADLRGGSETILVVEDDELVRDNVIAQLRSLGYRTLSASSGPEALDLVDRGIGFDLLFTDVIMPGGMNGRELATAVVSRRPSAKVLYTSGYAEDAIVHHGRLDPNVRLLNKPYRKAELAQKIREALGAADEMPVRTRAARRRRSVKQRPGV